jgi:hypothetical protein
MAAVELTVAALLSMTTNLQASVAAMDRLDFERAEAEATRVIDAAAAPPHVAEAARILRARAVARGGRGKDAVQDLEWVRAHAVSEGLRVEASAELRRLDGPAGSSTRAPRTPRRDWAGLGSAVARGDDAVALKRVQGPLLRLAEACNGLAPAVSGAPPRAASGLAWVVNEWRGAKVTETVDGDSGTLALERNGLRMTLAARNTGEGWVFHDLVSLESLEAAGSAAPPALEAAPAAAAGPNAQIAVNIAGGHAMAFGAGGGVAVVNGRVIHLGAGFGGDVQIRLEPEPAAVTNVPPISEAQRDEVEALVRNLGAADAVVRAQARARLKGLGPAAHPVLKEHRADADVEIATTVRELLGE